MHASDGDVPGLLIARVETPAGPFAIGDRLAVAFNRPDAGRVTRLEGGDGFDGAEARRAPIPDAIFAAVVHGTEPYAPGDTLALWFVDPRFVRIQSSPAPVKRGISVVETADSGAARDAEPSSGRALFDSGSAREPGASGATALAVVRLHWNAERVRRFVQVVDRLFTVDRLGWYRHALAMRLLIPDTIACADATADAAATRQLDRLRSAALEALGAPLLEAFMPNFSVSAEWLDGLDAGATARAVAELRATLEPGRGDAPAAALEREPDSTTTVGIIDAAALSVAAAPSVEATLPAFIANRSAFPDVTERLTEYRDSLLELFGQTARSAQAVRLAQMTEPCHALDDRLWQLAGVVAAAFGGLAPA